MNKNVTDQHREIGNNGYTYVEYSAYICKIRSLLLEKGLFLFLGGAFIILLGIGIFQPINQYSITALLISGALGLTVPLYNPGRPIQVGFRYSTPNTLSPYEKRINVVIFHFRKRLVMIFAIMPYFYFLIYLLYNTISNSFLPEGVIGEVLGLSVFSLIGIWGVAFGVQYLQIGRSIGKELARKG